MPHTCNAKVPITLCWESRRRFAPNHNFDDYRQIFAIISPKLIDSYLAFDVMAFHGFTEYEFRQSKTTY